MDSDHGDEVQKSNKESYDCDEVSDEQDPSSPEEITAEMKGCKLFQCWQFVVSLLSIITEESLKSQF